MLKKINNFVFLTKFFSNSLINNWQFSEEKETNHILPKASDIINEQLINETLVKTRHLAKDVKIIDKILKSAKERAFLKKVSENELDQEFIQGLTLEETATLLNVDENNKELMNKLFQTSLEVKERIYGNRIVLFAPLYVSNYCTGSCLYCGFREENKIIQRMSLTKEQLIHEVESIEDLGHKRIMMLTGESPKYSFDEFLEAVKTAASVKSGPHGEIRRINVEIPQLSISDLRRLKATNCVGTYVLFQETYHKATHKKMHPTGDKGNYEKRLLTMDRAMIAGVDDVGIGALFGLYDYRFEVMGLLQHAQHLDKTYKAGPHTISIPRIRPADYSDVSNRPPYEVNDNEFRKLVSIIRLAVPYTGMILTTRESPELRKDLLNLGISQMSAGSKTDIGSYSKGEKEHHEHEMGQFTLYDHRPTNIVIRDLLESGFIPSWCTACYRVGRTGPKFMSIAKKGEIHNMCSPNAILTLSEYLIDYADEKTKEIGWKVVESEIEKITSGTRKKQTLKFLDEIKEGKRDLYF